LTGGRSSPDPTAGKEKRRIERRFFIQGIAL
jgi:hypothetical protein